LSSPRTLRTLFAPLPAHRRSNRKLQDEAERALAEVARFKKQVAEQVQADAAGKGAALPATATAPKRESFVPVGSA